MSDHDDAPDIAPSLDTAALGPTNDANTNEPGVTATFQGEFQKLLQLASHLKSAQPEVREKRARWERLRFHQKNTVLFQEQDVSLRYDGAAIEPTSSSSASFDTTRMPRALEWKAEAGEQFKSTNGAAEAYQRASLQYQRCIGLFQWARKYQTKDGDEIEWNDLIEPTNCQPPLAQRIVSATATTNDQSLIKIAASNNGPLAAALPTLTATQRDQAQQLVFTCLVNIAACEEKLQQWHQVIEACEAALNMSFAADSTVAFPQHTQLTVKALFRCATAYNRLDELEKAIELLQRASKLAPKDALVVRELASLQMQARAQQAKDKQSFGGMFERGEIFEGDQPKSSFEPAATTTASTTASAPNQTKAFMADYLSGFRQRHSAHSHHSAASKTDEFDGEIGTSKLPSSKSSSRAPPSDASLAAMYAEAKQQFGIDLSDPLVQEELKRLQEEHRRTGKTPSELEAEQAAAASTQRKSASSVGSTTEGASAWLGPALFCVILLLAFRWMVG